MLRNFYILLFLLLAKNNFATHIVGGEIYYDYKGNDNYLITLKVYRDCFNGIPPLDNPAYVFVYDASGNFIDSLAMLLPTSTILPPTISNPCFVPPTNVCVEEGIYHEMVNLPPKLGGYYLSYQRCCRNGTILNLINPGNSGTTYMAHIPGPEIVSQNSSPRFNTLPPIFICASVPLVYDHSATDFDGDSLYYEFCDPYDGASPDCAQFGPPAVGVGCPEIGPPPPFSFVNWQSPYSSAYPMSSSPAMSINQRTGLLTGTPNTIGQWVLGVCVSEYRNGILIDVNKRDFQFNVVDCPGLPVAAIPAQQTFCSGFQVDFTQTSVNAFTYHWDFGVAGITTDTSNLVSPTYTYATAGTYTVTLIINPGKLCEATTTTVFNVQPLLAPTFTVPNPQCLDGNKFNFTAGGAFQGNGTFNWNFGSNATPATSTQQNTTTISFNAPGDYPVTLTVSENGCTKSVTNTIHIYPKPKAEFTTSTNVSCILNPVQFVNTSTGEAPLTYNWNFGNGQTSTLQNPVITYSAVGTYNVSLIITSANGCKDTVTLPNQLAVQNPPIASFTATPLCDNFAVNFSQNSAGAVYYQWNFGDPSTNNDTSSLSTTSWNFPTSGTYTATLTINASTTCTDTAQVAFYIYPLLVPSFIPPDGQCVEGNSFNFTAGGAFLGTGTFSWNFGSHANPSTSNQKNPTNIVYDSAGIYPVTFTVTEHGCTKSYTDSVHVYPKPEALFGMKNEVGCVLHAVYFIDSSKTDTPLTYQWSFGDGTTSTQQNPVVFYQSIGTYDVQLIITTQHGCKDTTRLPNQLTIYETPIAGFTVSPRDTNVYYPNITMVDQSQMAVGCQVFWGDGTSSTNCDSIHHYNTEELFTIMQVVVNAHGCYDTAYSTVDIFPRYLFWMPNAFTPNNNGLNDVFKPVIYGVHDYHFLIFDRWGELIYETTNYEEGWNGFYKDHLCQNDVYVYKINFKDDVENKFHQYIGTATLVR